MECRLSVPASDPAAVSVTAFVSLLAISFVMVVALASIVSPLASARADASEASNPVSVTDDRGIVQRFDRPPARIVSLLPSLTETVCALGACGRLVGVDRFSNWPESVNALPRLGGIDDTRIERLFALAPDLVLVSRSSRVLDRLEALGLKVMALESQSLGDIERTLRIAGAALGRARAAQALIVASEAGVATARARIDRSWRGARVYFEVAGSPHAAGESSFIGELIARLGLRNIVPAALGPFPMLNPEFVVRAKPDLIMASRRTLALMSSRPGWEAIDALSAGRVCGFDDAQYEVLVRPGPRLAEAAAALAACVASLPARGSAR